jgi:hypothetical protein
VDGAHEGTDTKRRRHRHDATRKNAERPADFERRAAERSIAVMTFGILPPPPNRPSKVYHVESDTKRAPADDGRKAATSSESAPKSQTVGSGCIAAVTDYDLIEELPLHHTMALAARRAERLPIEISNDDDGD